jgi:hypothetical protein
MNEDLFKVGDRIRISDDYHWAQGALGTIALPDDMVVRLSADVPWHGCWRHVQGVNRLFTFYWVTFDEPHTDEEGDDLYSSGEIDSDYLSLEHQ